MMENLPSSSKRRSSRTSKRSKASSSQEEPVPKRASIRKCGKASCPSESPSCFAKVADGCAKGGYTSRWYHMSDGEHFCNECFEFFYRSYREGNARFSDWKLQMAGNCRKELSIKLFFAEEILNYWVICSKCHKWRCASDDAVKDGKMDLNWQCSKADGLKCSDEEFRDVSEARSFSWLSTLNYLPLLKFSSPFTALKEYYPDGIGFSALSINNEEQNDKDEKEGNCIHPFYATDDSEKAGCYSPDAMQPDEKKAFPELTKQPSIYLGLRNLVISLWNSNSKNFHSLERCMPYVVIRGLSRVTLCEILKDILDFLTLNGRINFGIMADVPQDMFLNRKHFKGTVLIIGSGFAGISAARQLERGGCEVKVLEARNRIGGRVDDDSSLGVCVNKGPQIITGCMNNPVHLMCQQIDSPMRWLRQKCNLINSKGEIAEEEIDQKVEFYFNLMLESIEEMKTVDDAVQKLSLKDCLVSRKKDLEGQLYRQLTEEEEQLLEFHLANLEYACGAPLEDVSAFHWNQNESLLQFAGEHAWVEKGFSPLVEKLSQGLDIWLNCEITEVDYSGNRVTVTNQKGEKFSADKVIVAVPLSILKKNTIKFDPPLSEAKTSAIANLGAGQIEKVMMKFKKDFWKGKIEKADYFGRVPESSEDRGFACLFYDVSSQSNFVLMALIAGEAVRELKKMDDQQVIDRCLENLQKLFPNQAVSKPLDYWVSRWSNEKHIEMTYSFVGLNASGDDYTNLEETVNSKVYFAGETTNRRFPQTVTGAFISGLREARKILMSKI